MLRKIWPFLHLPGRHTRPGQRAHCLFLLCLPVSFRNSRPLQNPAFFICGSRPTDPTVNHHRIVNHRYCYSPVCTLTHSLTLIELASVSPYFVKVPPLTRAQRPCRFPRPLGKAVPRSCECSGPPCPRRISFWYVAFRLYPIHNICQVAIVQEQPFCSQILEPIKFGQSQLTLLPARPSGSASRC
jgi:hypothetical protein